jgi:hypothetical protein
MRRLGFVEPGLVFVQSDDQLCGAGRQNALEHVLLRLVPAQPGSRR